MSDLRSVLRILPNQSFSVVAGTHDLFDFVFCLFFWTGLIFWFSGIRVRVIIILSEA